MTLFERQNDATALTASPLQIRFHELQVRQPKLRRREIAAQLQVAEAALIDQQCGVSSIRLAASFAKIIQDLPSLGYIMTLTRNHSAVHERRGCYANVSVKGPMGLVISEDRKIDLRIIINRWASGYAVRENVAGSFRYSLQFFDVAGTAIQKIFLQAESCAQSYAELVAKFRGEFSEPLGFSELPPESECVESLQVDRAALVDEWQTMTNVHQFFGLLKKYEISREQAFSIVGEPLAQQFDPALLESFLRDIAKTDLSIMCFVGNRGNIQIHTGPIDTVKRVGPWLNILDPEFNLHLLEENISSAWLVRKPSVDGHITSLELYDAAGETIAQFFGQRTEGNPENSQWRTFAETLIGSEQIA